jgi:hypothetical protein
MVMVKAEIIKLKITKPQRKINEMKATSLQKSKQLKNIQKDQHKREKKS